MGPVAAVRACLRGYLRFSGRARRPEFWWFVLFGMLAAALSSALEVALGLGTVEQGGPVSLAVSLALIAPTMAVSWRRLHDVGRSGWWALAPYGLAAAAGALALAGAGAPTAEALSGFLGLCALAAFALLLFWFIRPGEPGANRHGPEPAA